MSDQIVLECCEGGIGQGFGTGDARDQQLKPLHVGPGIVIGIQCVVHLSDPAPLRLRRACLCFGSS